MKPGNSLRLDRVTVLAAEMGDVDLYVQVSWWRGLEGRSSDTIRACADCCIMPKRRHEYGYIQRWNVKTYQKAWSATRLQSSLLHLLMQGPTVSPNKTTSDHKRKGEALYITSRIEAVLATSVSGD